jgi:hypothetical protein
MVLCWRHLHFNTTGRPPLPPSYDNVMYNVDLDAGEHTPLDPTTSKHQARMMALQKVVDECVANYCALLLAILKRV